MVATALNALFGTQHLAIVSHAQQESSAKPRLPNPSFERIDSSYIVEEETLSGYQSRHYYPVRLGDVLDDRYKVIGKLGFGSASTVWLCRDVQKQYKYAALKIYINNLKYHRELPIYEEIKDLQSTHEGQKYIRKKYDSFELQGPHGRHICLVHQPLGMSLGELKELTPDGLFSAELIRQTLRCILSGLQFSHKEARVKHTDLQPSNMLLGIHDESVLAKFERYEIENPCPRKELDDRTIYLSRPMPLSKWEPCITDLSEGRFGGQVHTDQIMPNVYRAPEVILGLPWGYEVDVWGFAMVPKRLFNPQDSEGRYSEAHHLAQMISLLGPPPLKFLQRCETSLEHMDQRLEGEEKAQFMSFMRKMLQWDPEDRQDSDNIYWDEWLLADLIKSGEIISKDQPLPDISR
ncbi:kinase-like protein [Hortaea werneckii]|nr:kinase-like protein [Hortaea werneckii]KAI7552607.1 kinase-like protein [Hortaea werneckii]